MFSCTISPISLAVRRPATMTLRLHHLGRPGERRAATLPCGVDDLELVGQELVDAAERRAAPSWPSTARPGAPRRSGCRAASKTRVLVVDLDQLGLLAHDEHRLGRAGVPPPCHAAWPATPASGDVALRSSSVAIDARSGTWAPRRAGRPPAGRAPDTWSVHWRAVEPAVLVAAAADRGTSRGRRGVGHGVDATRAADDEPDGEVVARGRGSSARAWAPRRLLAGQRPRRRAPGRRSARLATSRGLGAVAGAAAGARPSAAARERLGACAARRRRAVIASLQLVAVDRRGAGVDAERQRRCGGRR